MFFTNISPTVVVVVVRTAHCALPALVGRHTSPSVLGCTSALRFLVIGSVQSAGAEAVIQSGSALHHPHFTLPTVSDVTLT